MWYRIYFASSEPVEVVGFDVRVIGSRRIEVQPASDRAGPDVEVRFGEPMLRIADDHDRTVYER